jgi:mannose-6-phosphate isomerase-like protein (cupin superfamily)
MKKHKIIENPIIGDRVTFLETAADSDNKHTLVEVDLAPEGGNQMHCHKTYSESFEVLEGVLGVQLGSKKMLLRAGESYTVPPNAPHRFFNPSKTEQVRFITRLESGHAGFEKSLCIGYGLARDGQMTADGRPKNLYHAALLLVWSEVNLPGLLRWLDPVFHWFARRAVDKGIDRMLLDRYCQIA